MDDRLSKELAFTTSKDIIEKLKPGYEKIIEKNFEECFGVIVDDDETEMIGKDELIVLTKNLLSIVRAI